MIIRAHHDLYTVPMSTYFAQLAKSFQDDRGELVAVIVECWPPMAFSFGLMTVCDHRGGLI